MQSFFWQVLSDSRVYARIQEEMKKAVAEGTIPPTGNISWNESQNLPYFQACLKEGMRVRPAVGLNIARLVPPEGAEIDGQSFPGGVTVAVNGWVLHRDKATFGEDADVYRPERWLGDAEEARRMERYMFQVSRVPHKVLSEAEINETDIFRSVRRWKPCLHRPQPCSTRDQQGRSSASTGLPF